MCKNKSTSTYIIHVFLLREHRPWSCPNQEAVPERAEHSRGQSGMGSRWATCAGRSDSCPDMLGEVSSRGQGDTPVYIRWEFHKWLTLMLLLSVADA